MHRLQKQVPDDFTKSQALETLNGLTDIHTTVFTDLWSEFDQPPEKVTSSFVQRFHLNFHSQQPYTGVTLMAKLVVNHTQRPSL